MIRTITKGCWTGAAIVGLACTMSLAHAGDRWLHVRVDEDGQQVKINVPLQLVESVLPLIEAEQLHGGKLRWEHEELGELDLKEILAALRDTPDAKFVTVHGPDESVQVAKEKGYLVVRAEERDAGEKIRVRVPMAVVEALLGGEDGELDLVAALRVLADYEGEDLVRVESDDSTVRIWIDSSDTGE